MNLDTNLEKSFEASDPDFDRMMETIAEACEGLIFVSETDSTVEPIALPRMSDLSQDELLNALDRDEGEPVETADALEFFDRLTRPRGWHSDEEKEMAQRFARLRDILESELRELRVYRVGEVRVDIFVLGRTRSGTIAGVHTRAVET